MPRQIQGSQNDFSAGEIDAALKRNDTHPARKTGLRQCSNFRILNSGSVQNRSGRTALFPGSGRDEKILVAPAVFYYLCFIQNGLNVRNAAGAIVATGGGFSWTTATCKSVVYALVPRGSSGVDVVITFAGQQPQIARYTNGSGWTFLAFAFATNGSALQEPFYRINVPGATLQASNTVGSVTVTSNVPYFTLAMVGSRILYLGSQIIITAFTDSTHVTATVQQTLSGSDQSNLSNLNGSFAPGDILVNQVGIEAEVVSVPGAIIFNYLVAGSRFSNADTIAGPNGSFTVSALTSVANQPTGIWAEEVMSALNGWPASCFYDQGRLGFCNFPSVPRGIAWSYIGIPTNFFVGSTPDAAMFELPGDIVQVLYVVPGAEGNEFVFCDNKIFYIPISVTNPLKPGSVAFNLLSDDGCAAVQPRATQDLLIYVNAGGNTMKAVVATGAFQRPFNTVSLNEFCSHLIKDVQAIAAPRADTTFQERYIYVLNGDNSLAVGKYTLELGQVKGIVGWVPFSGAGSLQWISSYNADVFFTTSYAPNGIAPVTVCEVLDDTQYLDCAIPVQNVPAPFVTGGKGPLFAFAGGSVTLIDQATRMMGTYLIDANGNIVPQFNGGEDLSVATLVAGQPWTGIMEPFAQDAASGPDMHQRMLPRRISYLAAYVTNSTGFALAKLFSAKQTPTSPALGTIMNIRRVPAWNQGDNPTLPPPLRETVEEWRPSGYSYDPRVALIKDTPGPLTVEEIGVEISI